MLVYAVCTNCRENSTFATSASTPNDLAREKGDHFIIPCGKCGLSFDAEAMQTRARVGPRKLLLGLGLSALLFALFWNFGYLAVIAVAPVIIIYKLEENAVNNYNRLSRRKWG